MQELIANRDLLIPYLNAFCRVPGLRGRGLQEDMLQEAAVIALENPRPLDRSQLYALVSEGALALIREERRHHPK